MVFKCYICNSYDNTKSLFRIPNRNARYSHRWRLWLKLINEKEENMHRIRICSDHFFKKKPAKKEDDLDIDWLPNCNLGRFSKNLKLVEHHLRNRSSTYLLQQETAPNNSDDQASKINDVTTSFNNDDSVSINNDDPSINSVESTSFNNDNSALNNNDDPTIKYSDDPDANNIGMDVELLVNLGTSAANQQHQIKVVQDCSTQNNDNMFSSNNVTNFAAKKRKIEVIKQQFFFTKEIQTELTAEDIDMLFQYYKEADEERNRLLLKISTLVIDFEFFKGNDKKTRFYTGLTTWKLLDRLFKLVEPFLPEHGNSKLSPFQMLALTLMKLRLNSTFTDLGYRFQVDVATASRYFHRCVSILYKLFEGTILIHWPDRKNLLNNTPSYFRSCFMEAVTIIIDCFEIFIETASMLRASAQGWSQYKHHATIKFLIGISITGAIIFISSAFGGRSSDKYITNESKLLDNLQEGDFVLADKGFKIEDEVVAKNANLQIPCFVKNGAQLHPTDVEETRELANVRIHVERVIRQLRAKYNMCSDTARMSAISKQNYLFDRDLYDKIVFVCCCLINMCPSVVTHDFEM